MMIYCRLFNISCEYQAEGIPHLTTTALGFFHTYVGEIGGPKYEFCIVVEAFSKIMNEILIGSPELPACLPVMIIIIICSKYGFYRLHKYRRRFLGFTFCYVSLANFYQKVSV